MFDRIPNQCWKDKNVQRQFFELVKKNLQISTEELLSVPLKTLIEHGGAGLIKSSNFRKFEVISSSMFYIFECSILYLFFL